MSNNNWSIIIINSIVISLLIFFLIISIINYFTSSTSNDESLIETPILDKTYYTTLQNYNKYKTLDDIEKITYLLTKAYNKFNPPILKPIEIKSNHITKESLLIRDRGINAFYFNSFIDNTNEIIDQLNNEIDNQNDNQVDQNTPLISTINEEIEFKNNQILKLFNKLNSNYQFNQPYLIEDFTDISFNNKLIKNLISSTILNLPIPTTNRRNSTTYFEIKLINFNPINDFLSIGLTTQLNYPNFQLPGKIPYSFSITSNGTLSITTDYKIIDDLVITTSLQQGDIIGIGFQSISGSLFITHNGTIIHRINNNFKFSMYPIIGHKILNKSNINCKLNVNFGQLGFVFIEGNVKKFGFCEDKNDGLIGAPPIYNSINLNNEILLDKGDDLPPKYKTDEFFSITESSNLITEKLINKNIVDLETVKTTTPPKYSKKKKKKTKKSKGKNRK